MRPRRRVSARVRRRRLVAVVVGVIVLALVVVGIGWAVGSAGRPAPTRTPSPSGEASASSSPEASPSATAPPAFDKGAHSIDDPSSIWVVVNKSRPLDPRDYEPADIVYPDVDYVNRQGIREVAADALVQLFAAARAEAGSSLAVQSAYRPYDMQKAIYDEEASANGVAFADRDTARPGYSEHQTGLTADISAPSEGCTLQACFGQTAAGAWLARNAWRFGFIVRYPSDKEQVTGYVYEPWHLRYVGPQLAKELHDTGVSTLEEFFGVPGGTEYH